MSNGTWSKVPHRTAAEVCARCAPGEEARKLLKEGLTPRAFVEQLTAAGHFPDAVQFLSQALPKAEAVWWACVCIRQANLVQGPALAAVMAAERWAAGPTEENRRAAEKAAEKADFGTPAGCAALAAFWSGGSMGPANVPAIPPADDLTGKGVAGAVMLAAVMGDASKATERFHRFLALGGDVASGTNRWK